MNIKCVVLVNSYDPPESIGTKKNQTILASDDLQTLVCVVKTLVSSVDSWQIQC